jgi:glycosyltransferase involved in cell wall biosynthesis
MLDTAASIGRTHSPSTAGGKIRLGYTSGTPTHQRDFAAVTPALAGALSAYPESILVIVGQLDIGSFTALEPYAERIEIRPIVPMDDLFGEIRRFDINLAPLEAGNPFCEAKSELRCILAGALGIPTIATATIPMQDAITDGENGILVSDPDMWPVALDRLLAHPDRIRSLGNAAAMNAKSRYGPEACFEKAETIFSKIIET